ncbi:MAG: NADH-quinone oxidoreductase subunit NuoE [Firmicutes bacterium]|nr:NADH-quinone oxidoreductase subunit NuoE [Bacillota bacterium]
MDTRKATADAAGPVCGGSGNAGEQAERVSAIIAKHRSRKGALLPILSDIQKELGCIPQSAMVMVAESLDIPASKVYGTATFYTLYSTRPKGKNVIRVCESAPCHVKGASAVVEALERALGIRMGETTPDGMFTLEFTSCIGVCAEAPAIMINDVVYGNLAPESIPRILAEHRATA